MSKINELDKRVYRLDRFVVPPAARREFLMRVSETHAILRRQPGFIQDFLVEKPADDGGTVIVTMVEWDSRETVERVVPVVRAAQRQAGFDPRETIARLGITGDIGLYEAIGAAELAPA